MTAHDELVERCVDQVCLRWDEDMRPQLRGVLAEVLRTLETATPEIIPPHWMIAGDLDKVWSLMLRASPLAPKAEGE